MASGTPAQDPLPLHATRQMLDELDALMERMLALPVAELDDPAASVHPEPRAALPLKSRPLAPTLTLLQMPPEEPVEAPTVSRLGNRQGRSEEHTSELQ